MTRTIAQVLSGLLCLFLVGCGIEMPSSEKSYQFYYINDYSTTGDVLVPVTRYLSETVDDIPYLTLVQAHINYGLEKDVLTAYPSGVRVLKTEMVVPQIVDVYFSAEYGELTGISRTVADYALTQTLMQLSRVKGVRVYIQGVEYDSFPEVLRDSDTIMIPLEP